MREISGMYNEDVTVNISQLVHFKPSVGIRKDTKNSWESNRSLMDTIFVSNFGGTKLFYGSC